eukprot:Protomagalhaensia_sp_Gyna_25__1323@NODE_1664_length_1647_cov_73_177861_g1362_i0_p1_GENE_NODE_1664_length_1647_cov_73_177861_g1362_i0NODE_1664_length_1647_cov_73_177861_g1362_i0_p1_ORF_typecomplete_len284_score36_06Yip1/PF04893_17/0_022DUF1129/PF06570_11/0_66DUF1129/PF06570_11/4e02_NODE_1664_length_1647_cov_73_177861_g1362_i07661617
MQDKLISLEHLSGPASTVATAQPLEFVSLGGSAPASVREPADGFEPTPPPRPPFLARHRAVLEEQFDVSLLEVRNELKLALTATVSALARRPAPLSYSGGSLSDVSDTFTGDWWGALWVPLTAAVLLATVPGQRRAVFGEGSAAFPLLSSAALFLSWTALVAALLYLFVTHIVRDPTFFGQPPQRRKLLAIGGYSLTPYALALASDALFGIMGIDRTSIWHFVFVACAPGFSSAAYLARRFPLQAIGAFAPGFDRSSARTVLWLGLLILFFLGAVTLQLFFYY